MTRLASVAVVEVKGSGEGFERATSSVQDDLQGLT